MSIKIIRISPYRNRDYPDDWEGIILIWRRACIRNSGQGSGGQCDFQKDGDRNGENIRRNKKLFNEKPSLICLMFVKAFRNTRKQSIPGDDGQVCESVRESN